MGISVESGLNTGVIMHFAAVAEMYTLCFIFGEFEIIFNGPVVYLDIVEVDILLS